MREPETLTELKEEILRQLERSETVTITLTEGDGIHRLLESMGDRIEVIKELPEGVHDERELLIECIETDLIAKQDHPDNNSVYKEWYKNRKEALVSLIRKIRNPLYKL